MVFGACARWVVGLGAGALRGIGVEDPAAGVWGLFQIFGSFGFRVPLQRRLVSSSRRVRLRVSVVERSRRRGWSAGGVDGPSGSERPRVGPRCRRFRTEDAITLRRGRVSKLGVEGGDDREADGSRFELRFPRSSELCAESPFGVARPRLGRAGIDDSSDRIVVPLVLWNSNTLRLSELTVPRTSNLGR